MDKKEDYKFRIKEAKKGDGTTYFIPERLPKEGHIGVKFWSRCCLDKDYYPTFTEAKEALDEHFKTLIVEEIIHEIH